MKKILLLLLLPTLLFSQNTWVNYQVQYDFYAPSESHFFMVSDANGDTAMFHQPTTPYEYLDTTMVRRRPEGNWGLIRRYYLYPYFGGNEYAPHDITIKIKE